MAKQVSARQVDGRMSETLAEPTHAPGCPCPRCTGVEVPTMDRTQKWRAAAASAIPYCAECGAILPEDRRGQPCEECEAKGVTPPGAALGGTTPRARSGIEFVQGGTLVVAVTGESLTHLVIKSAGWMEAKALADPRFFAVCKYPERVLDRLKIERVPTALIRCVPCRNYASRRGLDAAPVEETPLTRAIATYRAAGGGIDGRKAAARGLRKEGAFSDEVWKRFRRLVQSA